MEIACARCGSHDLNAKSTNTLFGATTLITCLKCGYRFKPGWDKASMETPEGQAKSKQAGKNLIFLTIVCLAILAFLAYFYFKGS